MTDALDAGLACDREGSVALITLDRPQVHNALNGALLAELDRHVLALAGDPTTRVIIITGAGSTAFCAGADVHELAGLDVSAAREALLEGQATFSRIERCGVPVIAAVNGLALGGGLELALACSFIVASENASFGLPETALGLMPGYGGTQRLPRLIGRHAALHVMLTGRRLSAHRAFELGLVATDPVAAAELLSSATSLAAMIEGRGPEASRRVIEAVNRGLDAPIDAGLSLEAGLAAETIASAEGREGMAAFQQRRPPRFGEERR